MSYQILHRQPNIGIILQTIKSLGTDKIHERDQTKEEETLHTDHISTSLCQQDKFS